MKHGEIIGWQFVGTLNDHFHHGYINGDGTTSPPNDDDHCCPVCCGPCSALLAMLDDQGLLDQVTLWILLTGYVKGGWDFWDSDGFRLNVDRIRAGWFRTDGTLYCINGPELHEELMREAAMAEMLDEGNRRLKESLHGEEG